MAYSKKKTDRCCNGRCTCNDERLSRLCSQQKKDHICISEH